MKKVLLIGYPFPLRRGGSPRLLGLAKYLPGFGWQPVILTAPLDERPDPRFEIVQTGYRETFGFWRKILGFNAGVDLRQQVKGRFGITARKSFIDSLLTLAGEIFNYPDYEKGWKSPAVRAGREILGRGDFAAIVSSSAPVTAHVIARELKARYHLPWVADLRDLWTQNHNYYYSALRKLVDRRLELKTLGAVDALVTVSQPWADKLRTLHRDRPVHLILNGFDPEMMNIPPAELTPLFTITYTGMIYPGKQDPAPLLTALRELLAAKVIDPFRLEVRFYGPREEWLEKEAAQFGLSDVVRQYGPVPHDVALQRQRESQVLLLLNWDDPGEIGTVPGKVFEYLAAMRPVLAIGGAPGDVVQQILVESRAGHHAAAVADIKEWLQERYSEYISSGSVAAAGNESSIMKYSQREMAQKFADVLQPLTV